MHMEWRPTNDFELFDPTPCDGISINFMLEGAIHSCFSGLNHELPMRAGTHNMIHTPDTGHVNQFYGNQRLSMLLVNLDKDFFVSSLGQGDAWSDGVLTDLEHQRPFSGMRGVETITPSMLHLLNDICQTRATGPMRNLLIQSRVLELVAMQIDQFRTPGGVTASLPPREVEKLHQLKAYLDANFLQEHSLAHLSRYCALNEFKVKKGFRQLFDTTVFNYLRQLRMDYAGRLLRHSSLSVDEIADQLGYEHAQHFSIAFKKYTGVTPTQHQHGQTNRTGRLSVSGESVA